MKYKRAGVAGAEHADLYQLLAYLTAADLPAGLLIYAASEGETVTRSVINSGKELEVAAIDLRGGPEQILGQVRGLAERVARMRAKALRRI